MSEQNDNPHLGSSLDSWLHEEGIYEEVTTAAALRVSMEEERRKFSRQMALALAPVFANHFLAQSETYSRMFAAQRTGQSHEELLKFQTGPLAQQILEMTRNFTIFAAEAFADHYFSKQ